MLHVRRYFCNPGAVTNPVHVQVQNGNFGALKFVNSEFQGQPSSIAVIGAGKLAPGENRFELENGTVSFIGCHFGDCKRAALALPVRRVRRVRHWPHAWLTGSLHVLLHRGQSPHARAARAALRHPERLLDTAWHRRIRPTQWSADPLRKRIRRPEHGLQARKARHEACCRRCRGSEDTHHREHPKRQSAQRDARWG